MKVDMASDQPTIDAHDPAGLLDLSRKEVQLLMRAGKTTSRFETGGGEDAGNVTLTLLHRGRRVRLTCTKDGAVLTASRVTSERR